MVQEPCGLVWMNAIRSEMVIHLARMPQSFLDKANIPAITHTLSTQIDLARASPAHLLARLAMRLQVSLCNTDLTPTAASFVLQISNAIDATLTGYSSTIMFAVLFGALQSVNRNSGGNELFSVPSATSVWT